VCEGLGPGACDLPPGFEPPPCELELLGKIAVEASIATYVPAATMNITTAIAASGRSRPWVRERCRPCAGAGANRSETSRIQSATRPGACAEAKRSAVSRIQSATRYAMSCSQVGVRMAASS